MNLSKASLLSLFFGVFGIIFATFFWSSSGGASDLPSNPAPGSTVILAKDASPHLRILGKSYSPAITIDASQATLQSIVIRDSTGIKIRNGTVVGHGGRSYAIHIDKSSRITIEDMTLTGAHRGIVINRSSEIKINRNRLVGLISDGVNIAESRSISVTGNSCSDFRPTPAIYDANGKRVKDGDHADCIQAWSRPTTPPVSDILVSDNRAVGNMQGIFFGNHIRNGKDDGGFDRIQVRNNYIKVSMPNGIYLKDARESVVTDNKVFTIAGSVLPNGSGKKVKANLSLLGSAPYQACGNEVQMVPNAPATVRC